ncbi:hypothetical protein AOQ84DRAFT_379777 [Glonium stellatum]|uniref:Uncharacterized protein n=1 Tax=Glonium stellatum TaxID=574774 RepID=A0A8E2JPX2_9PEZI|nr:hypothetical protein AOQ84DRAFT_379777 [Glonium stellatum]
MFASAVDIAAVALHTLTDKKLENTGYRIVGPEPLTHDEVAAKLSEDSKREIDHFKFSKDERVRRRGKEQLHVFIHISSFAF